MVLPFLRNMFDFYSTTMKGASLYPAFITTTTVCQVEKGYHIFYISAASLAAWAAFRIIKAIKPNTNMVMNFMICLSVKHFFDQ